MKKSVFGIVVLCLLVVCSIAYANCSVCGGNDSMSVERLTRCTDNCFSDTHTQYYVVDHYCVTCGNFLESSPEEHIKGLYPHIWSVEYINITYHNDANYHWKEGKRIKRCEECNKMITLAENTSYDSQPHYMSSAYLEDAGHVGPRHYYVVICGDSHCSRYYTISVQCKGGSTHVAPLSVNPVPNTDI